jgi:CHAT domain-containing protein
MYSSWTYALFAFVALVATVAALDRAAAISLEQAKEKCIAPLRPTVAACVRKHVMERGGQPSQYVEECKRPLAPQVQNCVAQLLSPTPASKGNDDRLDAKPDAQEQDAGSPAPSIPISPTLTARPRTVADVIAALDQEKPDPARVAKRKADADALPPSGASPDTLAKFYVNRGVAREELGRDSEAIGDFEEAATLSKNENSDLNYGARYRVLLALNDLGEPKRAIKLAEAMNRESDHPFRPGRLFGEYDWLVGLHLQLGNLEGAEANLRLAEGLLTKSHSWPNVDMYRSLWGGDVERMKANIFVARGRYPEAEQAYHHFHSLWLDAIRESAKWPARWLPEMERGLDIQSAKEGEAKIAQGRLAEGEADIRSALLHRLQTAGKYNAATALLCQYLAEALMRQGRLEEAEGILQVAIKIYDEIGYRKDQPPVVQALLKLAHTLNLQHRYADAAEVYERIDESVKNWDPARVTRLWTGPGFTRIFNDYAIGNIDAGLSAARSLAAAQKERNVDRNFKYARAVSIVAMGLEQSGQDVEALREFQTAIPPILAASRAGEDDQDQLFATVDARWRRNVIESYVKLLARNQGIPRLDAAAESFRVVEALRVGSVQRALLKSSARIGTNDASVASLMRKEQDLASELQGLAKTLDAALRLPPSERDDNALNALDVQIQNVRSEHAKVRAEIGRILPNYAELIDPKPPSVDQVRAVLRPDEALLSFFFGHRSTFVWAIPKDGPISFVKIDAGPEEIATKIKKLREGLEPQSGTLFGIPTFDVALAHELYSVLLQPVEPSWKSAHNLIVVTNGALGALPIGLLSTAPAQVDTERRPYFAGYRDVPWLARSHSVAMVPSAATLISLRRLPQGSPNREPLIGFGDPFFNEQQAIEASNEGSQRGPVHVAAATDVGSSGVRGLPIDRRATLRSGSSESLGIEALPRLPDTALELKSIALALNADPKTSLYLGRDANEHNVETIDLSHFRVVAFSTHGLIPGDLNGLTEPALALSAPKVAGIEGDGLLTMDEIFTLKLDADWVILSACNTGAASGAGAEAVSGLGKAFFYAGSRALLVTNWSVHSESARELVTDLFRRQQADSSLSRAGALRQAMMALLDSGGWRQSGQVLFTYAHPWFWAPYSIVGDGG